jgi:hypothetical protein
MYIACTFFRLVGNVEERGDDMLYRSKCMWLLLIDNPVVVLSMSRSQCSKLYTVELISAYSPYDSSLDSPSSSFCALSNHFFGTYAYAQINPIPRYPSGSGNLTVLSPSLGTTALQKNSSITARLARKVGSQSGGIGTKPTWVRVLNFWKTSCHGASAPLSHY